MPSRFSVCSPGAEAHALRGLRACYPPSPDGVHRSEVFPGLWLDARALVAEDLDPLFAMPEAGLASPEHAAFVAGLAARRVDL